MHNTRRQTLVALGFLPSRTVVLEHGTTTGDRLMDRSGNHLCDKTLFTGQYNAANDNEFGSRASGACHSQPG